jgi:hypothetical protein
MNKIKGFIKIQIFCLVFLLVMCLIVPSVLKIQLDGSESIIVEDENHTEDEVRENRGTRAVENYDWPMFHHDVYMTGAQDPSVTVPGNFLSKTFDSGGDIEATPAVVGDWIFFGNNNGVGTDYSFYGLNETFSWFWRYNSLNNWNWSGSPAVAEVNGFGMMVFAGQSLGSNNRFFGFDADPDDNNDGVIDLSDSDEGILDIPGAQYDRIWEVTLTGGFNRHSPLVANIPALGGNVIYLGTSNGVVYCLNASDGSTVWNWTEPTGAGFQYGHPTLGYGVNGNPRLFIINDGVPTSTIYGLKAIGSGGTTTVEWETSIQANDVRGGSAVDIGGPGADDDRLFFATYDDPATLFCFDASPDDDGNGIPGNQFGSGDWDEGVTDPMGMPWDLLWSYPLGGPSMYIASTPAVHNGRVYIGMAHTGLVNNSLFALEQNGTMDHTNIVWTYNAPGDIYWNSPAVADGKVIVTTRGYWGSPGLAVVDENTGVEIWYNTSGFADDVETSSTVAKGNIYVGGDDDLIHIFEGGGIPSTVDYIIINDTAGQGGNWVGDNDYQIGQTDTFHAHGFNNTEGYIGGVQVAWSSNDTGVGTVDIGPSSSTTFDAISPGYCKVTATYELNPSITNETGNLHVLDWIVDYILIVDTEGTGSAEISNQLMIIGTNITGWAAAFNDTGGYLGDIPVTWDVINTDGASASTLPLSGTNSTLEAGLTSGNVTWIADDGLGHNDTVLFTTTDYTVDSIMIVDTPGDGSNEIGNQFVDVGFTIEGWAAAFNDSTGYIGDISVFWSVTNISSNAFSDPAQGVNSVFDSGTSGGQATWTADDGVGHSDTVIFNINPPDVDAITIVDSPDTGGSQIQDQTVDVRFTIQGWAAGFNSSIGYMGDVIVSWSVQNTGSTAFTGPGPSTTSIFNASDLGGTAIWTALHTSGNSDSVNFTINPPTTDYIIIVDTQGIGVNEIPDQTVPLGTTVDGWAAAYNYTVDYFGDISVAWSVSNVGSTADTNPTMGENSTFFADVNPGTATWKADDGSGHIDTVVFDIIDVTVDYILIVDTPDSGSSEIEDQDVDVGITITGWAAAYNDSSGYISDISVTWTVTNVSSTSSTSPSTGTSSDFYSGTSGGTATWEADDGSGHTDTVIFTVNPAFQNYIMIVDSGGTGATVIPDMTVSVGFTIQGWAAAFNNTIGYLVDVSATWTVFNSGSLATTTPSFGLSSNFSSGPNPGTATWTATDGPDSYSVEFTITPPTIDYIQIVDTEATGANEIANQSVDVGFTIEGWAAAFNNSIGYFQDVSVNWSVNNIGSNGTTNPLEDTHSDFYSGWLGGSATWSAEHYKGHIDDVVFTVNASTVDYIMIVDSSGLGSNEILNQIVDIGFEIRGWAASYNSTTGYIGDISVTWSVDNVNTNATTSPPLNTDSLFKAGWQDGTATWISDDGNGHNDTVIFTVNPPSIDFIKIVDSQDLGYNEILDQSIGVGFYMDGWAAGFNNIIGYIVDVPASWLVINSGANAETDPASGTSSTFYSGNAGGVATWQAEDGNGHSDTVSLIITTPDVDYIQIRDAPDGGGNLVEDPVYPVGHSTRFYGALFNRTAGFIDNAPTSSEWNSTAGIIVSVTSPGEYSDVVCSPQNWGSVAITVDDGNGHSNSTTVTVLEPTTDELKIMDAQGGSGSVISSPDYPVGATDTFYGTLFNETAGYIGDVPSSSTWESDHIRITVTSPGSSSTITCSDTNYGTTTIILDDGAGHQESIVVEILTPTVDRVEIRDDMGSTGSPVADHNLNIGISATYYSVGFNNTAGNTGLVDVDWENSDENVGVLSSTYGSQTTFSAFSDRIGTTTISALYNSEEAGSFTVTVVDNLSPEADAGSDLTIDQGDLVIFDGTDSSDNVEIESYTWTFTYDGSLVTLEGETPQFEFDKPGFYEITLEITDSSGNTAIDTITLDVVAKEGEEEGSLWMWLLLLIIIIVGVLITVMVLAGKKKKKQRCRICGNEFFPKSDAEAKEGMCADCAKQEVFGSAAGSSGKTEISQSTVTIECPECSEEFDVQPPKGGGRSKVICPHCGAAGQMEI